jgi:putative endonuclease
MDARARGREIEEQARHYLAVRGLRLLQRNFRSRHGEIDLVMQDRDSLVFVEVRYRRSQAFGSAAESVDRHKQARLLACAGHYLQLHPQCAQLPCRFDVVSVNGADNTLDWIRNAFDAC